MEGKVIIGHGIERGYYKEIDSLKPWERVSMAFAPAPIDSMWILASVPIDYKLRKMKIPYTEISGMYKVDNAERLGSLTKRMLDSLVADDEVEGIQISVSR